MRFAASWSAWWLLLALPLVVLAGAVLYRRQSRDIAPGHAWGLLLLRVAILAAVVVLAFRPSLIRRIISTYPARLLLVLDDSASMGIADVALPDRDALALARQTQERFATNAAPGAELRADVLAAEQLLLRFEQFGRGADRSLDAFWSEADRVRSQVNARLDRVAERAAAAANATAADGKSLREAADRCRSLKASLDPLFTGNRPPPAEFVGKLSTALDELASLLNDVQRTADQAALAAGDPALKEALATVRGTPRLELVHGWLARHRDDLLASTKGLSLWLLPLATPAPVPFAKLGAAAPAVSTVETDLSGVLLQRLEEESPFPLAGIVVFSDGRNLGDKSSEAVTQAAVLREVPIFVAGSGGLHEPADLAVRSVYYPPFAVTGKPLGVRANLKTVLPKPETVDLELLNAAAKAPLAKEKLALDDQPATERQLVFTPEAEGLHRLTVRIGSVNGEVVPKANNSADLTVRVRPEPVRVLFLDERPRWESRFVLNILRRLDYLEATGLIVLAQPEGQLKRGDDKGCWPEDAATLALYDLIILGDLPPERLKDDDWQRLADYVKAGHTLALLGTGQRDPLPPAVAPQLLPLQPRTAATPPPNDTATLQLTPAGRYHPVTRALRDVLPTATAVAADRRAPETLPLLQTHDGRLLISARFYGKGKTLFMDGDRLWRRLNAVALDGHSALVAGLVDWAVEARAPAPGRPEPDLYRYTSREAVQVWTAATGATNPVVQLRNGGRPLEAPAVPPFPGAAWAAAVFTAVPPGDWTLALADAAPGTAAPGTAAPGTAAPEPLRVVDRSRELHDLSRDEGWLRTLAANTGGAYVELTDAGRLLNHVAPRSRIDPREDVWRLWDSPWILGLLVVLLTLEWVWRKLAGLA